MAVGQMAQAARERAAARSRAENERVSLGRQQRLEEAQAHDMIDMRVAQKNISRRGWQRATAKILAEGDDAGAGVEDQPAAIDLGLDARSIAADAESFWIDGRITAAHAPKAQSETWTDFAAARSLTVHLTGYFALTMLNADTGR